MSLVVGDIHQVRLYCSLQDQVAINTLYFRITAAPQAGIAEQEIANSYTRQLGSLWVPLLSQTATYHGCTYQRILPTKNFVVPNTEVVKIGTGPDANIAPKQLAGLVSYFDNTVTKAGRGRLYLPFPASGSNTLAGVPAAAYVTRMTAIRDAFMVPWVFTDMGGQQIFSALSQLFHRATKKTTDMWESKVALIWATQRRRGDYGRSNKIPSGLPTTLLMRNDLPEGFKATQRKEG